MSSHKICVEEIPDGNLQLLPGGAPKRIGSVRVPRKIRALVAQLRGEVRRGAAEITIPVPQALAESLLVLTGQVHQRERGTLWSANIEHLLAVLLFGGDGREAAPFTRLETRGS